MRFRTLFFLLLVLAAGITTWIYGQSLSYPFQFDDYSNIVQNRGIRYAWHPRILFEHAQSRPRLLSSFTYALNYHFSGLSLSSFRMVNLFLHGLNGLLVALLFLQWFRGRKLAMAGGLLSAALFLSLPLGVDAVVYLSARSSMLSLTFLLAGLLFHGVKSPGFLSWLGFLAMAVAGFLSKENSVVILPLLLVVHRARGFRWRESLPYILPLLLGGLFHLRAKLSYLDAAWNGFFHIQGEVAAKGLEEYTRLSVSLWPRIVELFFVPSKMSVDHQIALPPTWGDPLAVGGLLLWGLAVLVGVVWLIRPRFWQLPVLWLFVSLIPTNSLFPVLDPLAERHFYPAIPALAWALGLLLVWARRSWLVPALSAVVVLAAVEAKARVPVWRSVSSLWLDTYKKYPEKFRVAFNTAVYVIKDEGDFERALRIFYRYFAASPPGTLPYQEREMAARYMGNILRALGRDVAGIEALHASSGPPSFVASLALLKALEGVESEASWRKRWEAVLERYQGVGLAAKVEDPALVKHSLLLLRADHELRQGRPEQARALLEEVVLPFEGVHIPYWTVREKLGDLYLEKGMKEEALEQFELAAVQYKVFKQFPEGLHRKIYGLMMERGDYLRASDALGELVRVHSDSPEIRRLYAEALRLAKHRYAMQQAREAEFYSRYHIRPEDEREFIRP